MTVIVAPPIAPKVILARFGHRAYQMKYDRGEYLEEGGLKLVQAYPYSVLLIEPTLSESLADYNTEKGPIEVRITNVFETADDVEFYTGYFYKEHDVIFLNIY